MAINCAIPDPKDWANEESVKKAFKDKPKQSDMELRVQRLKDIIGWQEGISSQWYRSAPNGQTARGMMWNRMTNTLNKLGLQHANPTNIRRNNVFKFLNDLRRKTKGGIDEALANHEFEQKLVAVDRELMQYKKKYGLSDHQFGLMKTVGTEVGWQPFMSDYNSISVNGLKYLKGEQQRYVTFLSKTLGLNPIDVQEVVRLTSEPVQVFHEALLIARKAGINVGDLKKSGMGYFPHQYSKDYLRRMNWIREGDNIKFGDGDTLTTFQAFNKARESSNFIIEDEVVLDWLLKKYGGKNVYQDIGKRINKDVTGVADIYDNDMVLDDAIARVLPDATIDHLVESGLLSKIPLTTDRVFNRLKEAYDLPYASVNEVMNVDYGKAMQLYKKQLENMAVDANVSYGMVRGATQEGWGVTETEVFSNPELYKAFRPLSQVIPESLRERYLLGVDGFGHDVLGNTYVSPVVADLIHAEMSIISDPHVLGQLGVALSFLRKFNTTMWLSTSQFIGRQFISNVTQLFAAGGNPSTIAEDLIRRTYAGTRGQDMLQVWNNTKKTFRLEGEDLTERELYIKLISTGYINDYTQAGIQASTGKYTPSDSLLKQASRTSRQLKDTFRRFPGHFGKTTKEALSYIDEFIDGAVGSPFRFANVELETLAKFALAKTTFSKNKVAGFVTGSPQIYDIKNLDEFVDYSSRYFYKYDEPIFKGKVADAVSTVVPFLNYRTQNLHGTFKQLLTHPAKFANYLRWYAYANQPMEKEDLPLGGINDYVWDTLPIYYKIPKEESGLKDDTFFYFPTASLIQQAGAKSDIDGMWELLGQGYKSLTDKNPAKVDETPIKKLVKNESFLWAKFLYAAATGEDPDTDYALGETPGSKPSSMLGVKMSPWAKYSLGMLFPPLNNLDRWNPNDVFGQAPYYDQYNSKYVEGKTSWAGAERTQKDRGDKPINPNTQIQELMGIKGNFIDVAYNMGATKDDVYFAIRDNISLLKTMEKNKQTLVSQEERDAIDQQIPIIREYIFQLQVEHAKVDQWIKKHGFTTRQGLNLLRNQGLKTQNLPDISLEEKGIIRERLGTDVMPTGTRNF